MERHRNYHVQSCIGESEIHGHSKDKLGPIVTFSLEIWYSIVKNFKLEKDIGILRWITHSRLNFFFFIRHIHNYTEYNQ